MCEKTIFVNCFNFTMVSAMNRLYLFLTIIILCSACNRNNTAPSPTENTLYARTTNTRKGAPKTDKETRETNIETYSIEEQRTNVIGLGNPSYIAEIRQQLAERRKLLGLYAPEKKDLSGGMTFASFLIESGMLDEAEDGINTDNPK